MHFPKLLLSAVALNFINVSVKEQGIDRRNTLCIAPKLVQWNINFNQRLLGKRTKLASEMLQAIKAQVPDTSPASPRRAGSQQV